MHQDALTRHDNSTEAELACRELVELVTGYLEQDLSDAERRRFDAHLAECEDCVVYVEQMRHTIRTLGELRPAALTPETRAGLLEAFRSWSRTP